MKTCIMEVCLPTSHLLVNVASLTTWCKRGVRMLQIWVRPWGPLLKLVFQDEIDQVKGFTWASARSAQWNPPVQETNTIMAQNLLTGPAEVHAERQDIIKDSSQMPTDALPARRVLWAWGRRWCCCWQPAPPTLATAVSHHLRLTQQH